MAEHLREEMAGLGLQETEEDVFDSVFQPPLSQPAEDAAEEAASDYSPDDMTCAICLEHTPLTDIALVKGCEHQYCVHCILQWAMVKDWCPQCKKPFDYLLTHRQLDGTLTDYLNEESVVLLKRARWFDDHMRESEKGKAAMASLPPGASRSSSMAYAAADADHPDHELRSWEDFYEDYVDAELEEDEEIEQYYFSSAAGRARVVLGNRRWGEGGYMRAGRMYARPVQHTARTPNAAGGKATGKAVGKTATEKAPTGSSPGAGSSRAAAAAAADGAGGSAAAGSSSTAAAAAASNRNGGAGTSSSSRAINAGGSSNSRGRSTAAATSSSSAVAGWLDGYDDDDDDDDFDYDCYGGEYPRLGGDGGGAGSSSGGNRRGGSGSRSRSRPDRPAGMTKPIRQVPKNLAQSPVCSMAALPLVSPLGKSPGGSGGFAVGSWGASSSSAAGSTPGSGRRAKRNARRAAVDGGGGGGGEWD